MSGIGNIPSSSEVTPERLYLQRREFIKNSLLFAATSSGVGSTLLWLMRGLRAKDHEKTARTPQRRMTRAALTVTRHLDYASGEKSNSYNAVTNYNNFYEFGTDKSDPAANAGTLKPRPWQVTIEGEVARPQVFEIDELIKSFPLEERVYRMRCVEAWSMVIPWVGFPLRRSAEACRAHLAREIRGLQIAPRSPTNAGSAYRSPPMALRRRPAHRRSDASADYPGGRTLR